MKEKRNLLVLYSWEKNKKSATEWVMALCTEFEKYESVTASCDMLWRPQSNLEEGISKKIAEADNILVVVTNDYNKKINSRSGFVSFEESIYSKLIRETSATNKILFLLKENVALPKGWEGYMKIDVSPFSVEKYYEYSVEQRQGIIDDIIGFCFDIPPYEIVISGNRRELPKSQKVKSFQELFSEDIQNNDWKQDIEIPFEEQEKRLVDYIKLNATQSSFADLYIRSGLSADLNLNGRITPQLFDQYFLVKRSDREENHYNATIDELFNSTSYNCLCLQSDGGSGKSTFIQTMCLRRRQSEQEYYTNILLDLSNLSEYPEAMSKKEDLLFQRLKKEYSRMSKRTGSYYDVWRKRFTERVEKLNEISFVDQRLPSTNEIQEKLKEALLSTVPEEIDNWYFGYTNRITQAVNPNSRDMFFILMIVYLMILDCKPALNKPERFIFVFDNIETYDNERNAKRISSYVETGHRYLRNIFTELGVRDNFFTKFTFVIVLRTSTLIPFGNLQADLWSGVRFVMHLKYFDFTEEALLKKLYFLKKIENYTDILLYQRLYAIISFMLPTQIIEEYLQTGIYNNSKRKYYTSQRLLPLFNNNYRKTMQNLYDSIMNNSNKGIYHMIIELRNLNGAEYDYYVNGIRMAIIRELFNRLNIHNYFDKIGFHNLTGNEKNSLTRLILGYMYWDEVKHYAQGYNNPYVGVELSKISKVFNYFCNSDEFVRTLYDLSIYSNRNSNKGAALNEWGHLIVFDNINIDLTEQQFETVVRKYLEYKEVNIIIEGVQINLNRIYVRLSDAGMCFTQFYIRSYEFLMSRSDVPALSPGLFLSKSQTATENDIDKVYFIITNCIHKLIDGCEGVCVFYHKEKSECSYYKKASKKANLNLLSCALFIRCQECFDMIREAIDYIDRFRIIYFKRHNDYNFNKTLLGIINKYYKLYGDVMQTLESHDHTEGLDEFMQKWTFPANMPIINEIKKGIQPSDRVKLTRPIQSYYVRSDENFEAAIQYANTHPMQRIYDIIDTNFFTKEENVE